MTPLLKFSDCSFCRQYKHRQEEKLRLQPDPSNSFFLSQTLDVQKKQDGRHISLEELFLMLPFLMAPENVVAALHY